MRSWALAVLVRGIAPALRGAIRGIAPALRGGAIVIALSSACSDDDATASEPDAGHDAGTDADAGPPDPRLVQEAVFWEQVAICGDWVEGYPTIAAMAAM